MMTPWISFNEARWRRGGCTLVAGRQPSGNIVLYLRIGSLVATRKGGSRKLGPNRRVGMVST